MTISKITPRKLQIKMESFDEKHNIQIKTLMYEITKAWSHSLDSRKVVKKKADSSEKKEKKTL